MRLKFLLLIGVVLFFAANPSEGNESTLIEVNGSDRLGVVFSIDCSRSMNELDASANNCTQIAKDLVGLLDPLKDKVGLVTWGKKISSSNDLTEKFDDINESLDYIPTDQKASNLDRGLRESINMLKNNYFHQKAIVLFSDGVPCCNPDEVSYIPPPNSSSPIVEAEKEGIRIYTVAFGDYNSTGFKNLSDMSNYTGGSTYLISDTKSVRSTPLAIYNDVINNNKTPKIFNLTSNLSSPQNAGTRIKWTADARDPENDTIYYQFRFNGASTGRDWKNMADYWAESNTSIWNSSEEDVGDYQIQVRVRDNLHEEVDDSETKNFSIAYNWPPTISNLTSNLSSPQELGTRIEWIADANDPENDTIYYQFWLNGNSTCGNWTTSNSWIWNTSEADVGDNQIQVCVRDNLHEYVYDTETRNFTINPAINLMPNPSSPQDAGIRIEWTAVALGLENNTTRYQFWLNGNSTRGNWTNMTEWTTSNTWIWSTSEADVGDNQIRVSVRDNRLREVYYNETENFFIFYNSTPTIFGLTSNLSSPQELGARIEWIADARDPENDTIYYQFRFNGASTIGEWKNMAEWTTSNTSIWNTSEAGVGDYQIQVRVHDDLHEYVYDTETRNFTINPAVYLTSNLSSPQNAGTWIEWTADVLGLENSTTRYQFWLNGNSTSGNWKEMTEWTENKSWIWNTSEDDVGDNQIQVRVRDNLHEDVDDSDTENFTIKSIDDDGEETIKTESDSTDYSIELRSSGIKLIRGNWSHEDNETNVIVTKEISVSNGTSTDIKITIEMPNQTNPSPRKINAVFALDTSGSMRKYYRNDANESAEMVQAWSRFDNVSIVSWDHKHETLSGPIPVAENEDQLASILDNLADRCSEKDLTYYDEGLNGSLAILRNRSAEPVGPEKIIIFLTGFGEFKPGDHLDEYVNEAKESGYKIFAIGVEIDETSNTSKDQYLVLKNMSESTGGEFYNMSSFNSEELNDIMAKITAEFPNDSIDSSPARNVVATDTLFPYLIVNDSNSSNIAASKGNVTAKTNPDETTTLTWNVGDMNLNESVTMTIHTTFDLTLPADVGRDNKWICYKADETTPESEVAYNWLVDGTWNRRFIEIPAGEIRVTQESTPLATPINSFDIWRS